MSFYTLGSKNYPGFIFIGPPKTGTNSIRRWTESLYGIDSVEHESDSHYPADHSFFNDLNLPYIGIIRNPYDRMVSAFTHTYKLHQKENLKEYFPPLSREGFEEFVTRVYDHDIKEKEVSIRKPMMDYFKKDNELINFELLIRLENIESDWKLLQQFCQTTQPGIHVNRSILQLHKREIYTPKAKLLVEEMWGEDIWHFRYSF